MTASFLKSYWNTMETVSEPTVTKGQIKRDSNGDCWEWAGKRVEGKSVLVEATLAETLPQSDSVKAHYTQERIRNAAPELLEALQAIVKKVDYNKDNELAIVNAVAAITKATQP